MPWRLSIVSREFSTKVVDNFVDGLFGSGQNTVKMVNCLQIVAFLNEFYNS
jgi:hypothetical protein